MQLGIIGLGRMGANMTERLAESAFHQDPELASMKKSVPVPVLMLSLFARFASRQEDSFSAKVIAALRNEFGGHAVKKA